MRKLMWRLGRLFDLGIIVICAGFTTAAIVSAASGDWLLASSMGCGALAGIISIIRLIRTGSFLQPW